MRSRNVLLIRLQPETQAGAALTQSLRDCGASVTEHLLKDEQASYVALLDGLKEDVLPVVVKF